jgi:hypothetical protein
VTDGGYEVLTLSQAEAAAATTDGRRLSAG